MTPTKTIPTLGEGIFTAYDAAHILSIKYGKINYWFNNQVKEQFKKSTGHDYFFEYQDIRAVNFYSLIELYFLQYLREKVNGKHRYTFRQIIEYHTFISKKLNTPYPFASSQVLVHGNELLLSLDSRDNQIVTANAAQQLVLTDVIKRYAKRIVFGEDGLAFKYYPLADKKTIVVNRHNQFGQPIIEGTNIKASTIYNYILGGESKESIANLYDLSLEQVEDAITFAEAA